LSDIYFFLKDKRAFISNKESTIMDLNSYVYLVAGYTYQLNIEDIKNIPSLILNNEIYMKQFYDPIRQVYCISRNRAFFELLVFYINHGILSRPIDIPLVSI
jgi:hypothetical protein